MRYWVWGVLLGVLLLTSSCKQQKPQEPEEYFAGAWLALHGDDGYLSDQGQSQMKHLFDLGIRWVAYAPEPSMEDVTQPEIVDHSDMGKHRQVIRALHQKGHKVLLFPRIESPTFFRKKNPLWRGDIAMGDEASWSRFHDNMEKMLVTYATMAEEEGVEFFCMGLEYRHSTTKFPQRWRQMIKALRTCYSGKITYSANWYQEFEQVSFWDDLDYIGVGAYFPVTDAPNASHQRMRQGWMPILSKLKGLSQQYGRKLIFTEVGYPCVDQAGWKPWEWTTKAGKSISQKHQADCYRAFFDTFRRESWFNGFFIWRFHTDTRYIEDWEYSPQDRMAEEVIREELAKPR